jgi:hypothetical protein
MVVEISHLEVVLMMDCGGVHCSGVCTVPGNFLFRGAKIDRTRDVFPAG